MEKARDLAVDAIIFDLDGTLLNSQKEITPEYIISVVAEHYHVTTADLCGNKRSSVWNSWPN